MLHFIVWLHYSYTNSYFSLINQITDRKVDPDGVAALASRSYDRNHLRIEIARGITNACVDVTDAGRCEAAVKTFECMHNDADSKRIFNDDL